MTLSGWNPTCCTPSSMPSKTAPSSTSPPGTQPQHTTNSPATRCIPSCWRVSRRRTAHPCRSRTPHRCVGPVHAGHRRWRMAQHQSAGLPMIHPLFTPFNEDLADRLNGGSPATDVDTFADTVISCCRRGRRGDRHCKRSHGVRPSCRRPPVAKCVALHRGNIRRVRVRIVERVRPHRQRTRCDVQSRHQHPGESGHRQRDGIPTTVDGISLRPTAAPAGMMADVLISDAPPMFRKGKSRTPSDGPFAQRPSACEADGKSVLRRLCWSNWTNWTHLEGSAHAI